MYRHNRIGPAVQINWATMDVTTVTGPHVASNRTNIRPWLPSNGLSGEAISVNMFYENSTSLSAGEGVGFGVALSSLSALGHNSVEAVQLELSGSLLHSIAQGEHPTLFFIGQEDDDSPVNSWVNVVDQYTFLANSYSSETTGDYMSFNESLILRNPEVDKPIIFGCVMFNFTSGNITPDFFRCNLNARYCLEDIQTLDVMR